MEKRKAKDQDSSDSAKKKKHKKSKKMDADSIVQNLEHSNKDSDKTEANKSLESTGKIPGKKSKDQHQKNDLNKKTLSVQNLLTEKLMKVQRKRSENVDEANTGNKTRDKADRVNEASETADVHNERLKSTNDRKNKAKDKTGKDSLTETVRYNEVEPELKDSLTETVGYNEVEPELEDSLRADEEKEDPEKAAIREKKREKRKQKKLEKEKIKQQNSERAGTAQTAATDYLKQWKNQRDEWKFLKVRQVWLLQNMYDQTMVDDSSFDILLEYLEGLRGKSREVTVSEAEKVMEKVESEEEESASVKFDRARQIIQLLSD